MIEALRRLGIAARCRVGYIAIPGDHAHGYVGGGSTHAWVQVYLPSAGWIEFDPTNGIVGTRDLIRVAVARDPHQADPAARHLPRFGRAFVVWRSASRSSRTAKRQKSDHGIRVGFEIAYTAVQPTADGDDAQHSPSRYQDIVGTETIVAEPDVPIGFYRDSFGNVCGRLVAPGRRRDLARQRAGARFRIARRRRADRAADSDRPTAG